MTMTTGLKTMPSSGSLSFLNVVSNQGVVGVEQQQQYSGEPLSVDSQAQESVRSSSPVSNKSKVLPPIPRDFGGASATMGAMGASATTTATTRTKTPSPLPSSQVDKEVFESIAKNQLSVRFEITIVKVCSMSLWCVSFVGVFLVQLIKCSFFFCFLGFFVFLPGIFCFFYRSRCCRFMGYSLGGRVVMDGSIRCWRGGL